jgi:hypothetical protein
MNNQIQPQEQQHIAYANPDSISCEGLYINFLPFSIELGPQAMQTCSHIRERKKRLFVVAVSQLLHYFCQDLQTIKSNI